MPEQVLSEPVEEPTPEPVEHVMDLIFRRWRSQALYNGVELGVFEALGSQTREAEEVAEELGLDPTNTYRLMRALGSLGLLDEEEGRSFRLTEAGRVLRTDHPESLRDVVLLEEASEHHEIWKHLPDRIREGDRDVFQRGFGHPFFDQARLDSEYARAFDEAMSCYSRMQTSWVLDMLEGYDLSRFDHVCDVGGGHGHLLAHVLDQEPSLTGTVLELPHVVEDEEEHWASRVGVEDRLDYVAGDMFETVPEADAYFLKMVLHDWTDAECVRILDQIRRSASEGARLFVVEHVIPGPDKPHFSKLFDVHMMCVTKGRERTLGEYDPLFAKAGWERNATHTAEAAPITTIEAKAW